MTPEIISLILLALMFIIATWRDVNMGFLGFLAAAVLGVGVLGLRLDDALIGFPIDLFVTLVGLTYLFGFAQNNGAIDVLVRWSLKLVRGKLAIAPWVFFFLTAILIAFGALFAVAIIAPLALRFARRNGVNQFMTGLLVVHGALAGAFSPLSVYGVFISNELNGMGFENDPLSLFLAPFIFNLVFAAITYLIMHRRPGPRTEADAEVEEGTVNVKLNGMQLFTLILLAVMAILVIGFGLDIGVITMALGVVLAIVSPSAGKAALAKVSWSVVVLITGVLTYIHMLEEAGTVDWVSNGIASIGIPLIAALLLFYMAGFVSALASSLGIIGVVMSLAGPFIASGDVHVGGFVAALAIAATIVDISPFSTNGAMLLANVDGDVRDKYYSGMLKYAGTMCLVGPGAAWLVVAVPTWVGM
ncbi:MAG: SLC13 family permease [Gulosibacter sp.]|uniref:SLC13 family permease n=1 Tax=Gulosibacter sp. TaxID=2817531 RepID=UPI003F8F4D51